MPRRPYEEQKPSESTSILWAPISQFKPQDWFPNGGQAEKCYILDHPQHPHLHIALPPQLSLEDLPPSVPQKRQKKSSTKPYWNQTVYASCCNNKNCPYAAQSSTDNVEEPHVQQRRQTKEKNQEKKKKKMPQTIALLQGSQHLPQRRFVEMQYSHQPQYVNLLPDNKKEQGSSDIYPLNRHSSPHFPLQEKPFSDMNLPVEKSERPALDEQLKDLVKQPSSHFSLLAQKQFLSNPLMKQQNISMQSFYENPLQQRMSPVENQEQLVNFPQHISHSHQTKYRHGSEVSQFVLSQQIPSVNQLNHNKQWLTGDRLNPQSLDQQVFAHKPHLIGRQTQLYKCPLDEGLQSVSSDCKYCPICGEILKENQSIEQHMQLEHIGDGPRCHSVLVQPQGFQQRHDQLTVLCQQPSFGFGQEKHQIWGGVGRKVPIEQQAKGQVRLEPTSHEQEKQQEVIQKRSKPKDEQQSCRTRSPKQQQNHPSKDLKRQNQDNQKHGGVNDQLSLLDELDINQNTEEIYLEIMKNVQTNDAHDPTGKAQPLPGAAELKKWISLIARRLISKPATSGTEEPVDQLDPENMNDDFMPR